MELLKSYEFYYCQFLTGFQEALVFRLHQDSRGQPPCFAQISVGHVKSTIVNHGNLADGMVWSCKAKPGCSINAVDFSQLPAGEERAEVPGIKGGTDRNRLWWNFGWLEVYIFYV